MAAKLVAEEGLLKGLVLSLDQGETWVIGRDPDACQLLIEDPSTSKKHLVCRRGPNGILVENLSQTNPIEVNNEEVKTPRLLQDGDALKIGSGMFRFYSEAAAQVFQPPSEEPSILNGESDIDANADTESGLESDDQTDLSAKETDEASIEENESFQQENLETDGKEESLEIRDREKAELIKSEPKAQTEGESDHPKEEAAESSDIREEPKDPAEDKQEHDKPDDEIPQEAKVAEKDQEEIETEELPEIIAEEEIAKEEAAESSDIGKEPKEPAEGKQEHDKPDDETPQEAEVAEKDQEGVKEDLIEDIEAKELPEKGAEEDNPEEDMSKEEPKEEETNEASEASDENEEPSASLPQPESLQQENQTLQQVEAPPEELEDIDIPHDSIFNEEPTEHDALAEINFGLLDTGRWLLKVISGPNNGAEFSMNAGSSYIIGTDPNSCDIVFHDTSVSRQHAKISVSQDDALIIEDLKSSNGTLVDGESLKEKKPLLANNIVSLGTSAFVLIDREGEMQTIISPLLPSIVKVLQRTEVKTPRDLPKDQQGPSTAPSEQGKEGVELPSAESKPPSHPTTTIGAFILIGIITGLFVIVGIGTSTLFKSEPIEVVASVDPIKVLDDALAPFAPNVKYTFNKGTGRLLLVGHVKTATDKNRLLYSLQGLKFIKNLDDSGIIIDEYVWREINQILGKNPTWKGITVSSSAAGHFVLTGYLKTRAQAEQLNEYMSINFPYLDLLEKKIAVEEDIVGSVSRLLDNMGFKNITVSLNNGEVILSGKIPIGKSADIDALLAEVRTLPGIRTVKNELSEVAPGQSMINISDRYDVTGISKIGGNLNVVINGRILMKGDVLDGMTITSVQANMVLLEKGGIKYRIDFNK